MKNAEQWCLERQILEEAGFCIQDIKDIQQDVKDTIIAKLKTLASLAPDNTALITNIAKNIEREVRI